MLIQIRSLRDIYFVRKVFNVHIDGIVVVTAAAAAAAAAVAAVNLFLSV